MMNCCAQNYMTWRMSSVMGDLYHIWDLQSSSIVKSSYNRKLHSQSSSIHHQWPEEIVIMDVFSDFVVNRSLNNFRRSNKRPNRHHDLLPSTTRPFLRGKTIINVLPLKVVHCCHTAACHYCRPCSSLIQFSQVLEPCNKIIVSCFIIRLLRA